MQLVRTIIFNVMFFITLSVFLIGSFWIVVLPMSYCNKHLKAYFRLLFWLAKVILGLKVEVRGAARLRKLEKEEQSFIVLSKHQSSLETFFYPAFFKEYPVFVHKKELLYIPFWGWYMAKMQMISIDRSSGKKALDKMVDKAKRVYAQGRPIVIFPEGTRTLPGESNKYKSGFYQVYKNLDVKVVPIALNTGMYWNKKDFIKKPGTIIIEVLPVIEAGLPKKELMSIVEKKIETETKKLCK